MNLATRLLVDGFNGEYEQAVVVSNDADFAGSDAVCSGRPGASGHLGIPDSSEQQSERRVRRRTYVKRLWKSHLRRRSFPTR